MRPGFALVVARSGPKIHPVPDEGGHNNNNRPGKMERLRTTMDDFASAVSVILRQPVVDETHMEGRYNVETTYAPDYGPSVPAGASDGPSIFTAIEERVGMKLLSRVKCRSMFLSSITAGRCRQRTKPYPNKIIRSREVSLSTRLVV